MSITAAMVRAALEHAGAEHWQALVDHHESAYPRPAPTPGAIAYHEATRLNELGFNDGWELVESRATRHGDSLELVHGLRRQPADELTWTEPFRDYEPEAAGG